MFKVGDHVKLKGFTSKSFGEVIEVDHNNVYAYKIKWAEGNESRFSEQELELYSSTLILSPGEVWLPKGKDNFIECKGPVCQCGVDTLGYGKHSDWCEKHD